ncbi:hypothetical protein, unknown function [Leishmania tarentolae]|uniref:Uncharacterized protein n=1 Tax=Leishmania tarentolae TaxID=5689 RepID=A0A640KIW8_LEITA|nr:hypothetical protein, unknown function [Leishmania tarentolae]
MGSKPSKRTDKTVVAPARRNPSCTSDRDALSKSNVQSNDSSGGPGASASVADPQSPERRGFNNPVPARQSGNTNRTEKRQTRMVGAEDADGAQELDERPFHQEKVNRVPTKALLKPPKNPTSVIADPNEEDDLY